MRLLRARPWRLFGRRFLRGRLLWRRLLQWGLLQGRLPLRRWRRRLLGLLLRWFFLQPFHRLLLLLLLWQLLLLLLLLRQLLFLLLLALPAMQSRLILRGRRILLSSQLLAGWPSARSPFLRPLAWCGLACSQLDRLCQLLRGYLLANVGVQQVLRPGGYLREVHLASSCKARTV